MNVSYNAVRPWTGPGEDLNCSSQLVEILQYLPGQELRRSADTGLWVPDMSSIAFSVPAFEEVAAGQHQG